MSNTSKAMHTATMSMDMLSGFRICREFEQFEPQFRVDRHLCLVN
ncbi:MAG: hypothetical protein UZ12_BCD005001241 [Bacteroidetes bacterium OLB12]|nr:MAG: hypothetical protein UZ12_BCD005001241 [Bacteroidetes bacterium OLB12]